MIAGYGSRSSETPVSIVQGGRSRSTSATSTPRTRKATDCRDDLGRLRGGKLRQDGSPERLRAVDGPGTGLVPTPTAPDADDDGTRLVWAAGLARQAESAVWQASASRHTCPRTAGTSWLATLATRGDPQSAPWDSGLIPTPRRLKLDDDEVAAVRTAALAGRRLGRCTARRVAAGHGGVTATRNRQPVRPRS